MPRGREGFILAEALVSLGLAALTGALGLSLLIFAVRSIERSSARAEAAVVVERLYEEARLISPQALSQPAAGAYGPYRWRRVPGALIDPQQPTGARRVRFETAWQAGGRPASSRVEAIVVGAGS